MGIAGSSVREVDELLRIFALSDTDSSALAQIKGDMMESVPALVSKWYEWLATLPEYEEFFSDSGLVEAVQKKQVGYWDSFFSGTIDAGYVERRRELGTVHARIGLPLDAYIAGVDHWTSLFVERLRELGLEPEQHSATRRALNKYMHLDVTVVVASYEDYINHRIAAQSKSLIEMSTPVTQIWDGILLLPLVGIVDSKRAMDIMNTVLSKISETRVQSFILDISGVAVVDTAVANHLIKITKATRMMGCESIISGVSPAIAQTVVELGIEIGDVMTTVDMRSAMDTVLRRMGLSLVSSARSQ